MQEYSFWCPVVTVCAIKSTKYVTLTLLWAPYVRVTRGVPMQEYIFWCPVVTVCAMLTEGQTTDEAGDISSAELKALS